MPGMQHASRTDCGLHRICIQSSTAFALHQTKTIFDTLASALRTTMNSEPPPPPLYSLCVELNTTLVLPHLPVTSLTPHSKASRANQTLVDSTLYTSITVPPCGGWETKFARVLFTARLCGGAVCAKEELGQLEHAGIRVYLAIERLDLGKGEGSTDTERSLLGWWQFESVFE